MVASPATCEYGVRMRYNVRLSLDFRTVPKFLADECVDRSIVDRLRHDGHTVLYVAEMEPGISDHDVLDLANHERGRYC